MKRILLFIIFFYFGYFLLAQIPFGTPVNFCSFDGTIYNPGCHNGIADDMWVVTDNSGRTYTDKVVKQ